MAIVQPHEMNFTGKNFSMIIAGSPGVGKTTLAMSAPNPVLIDFDKGVSRVKAQHRKTTAMVNTYEELLQDMESDAIKNAETLVIDTGGSFITYLQDWAVRKDAKLARAKLQMFGVVKGEFANFTNKLQYVMRKNIIYVFHTTEEKKGDIIQQRLLCEGSARNTVWQPCDLGAYLFVDGDQRYLGFTPTEEYFAKGCYGISGRVKVPALTEKDENNFLTSLFEKAKQNIADESKVFDGMREKYDNAMSQIADIIATVEDAKTATEAAGMMQKVEHALTSQTEARDMFSKRTAELGLKWDKGAKEYVAISDNAQPAQ